MLTGRVADVLGDGTLAGHRVDTLAANLQVQSLGKQVLPTS